MESQVEITIKCHRCRKTLGTYKGQKFHLTEKEIHYLKQKPIILYLTCHNCHKTWLKETIPYIREQQLLILKALIYYRTHHGNQQTPTSTYST